jgi:ParB/RepB/Spo0J family partition protein
MERMKQSLAAHGQLTPVVVVDRGGKLELVDGFKRRAVAVTMGWKTLLASVRELDERGVWVAMLVLNRGPGSMTVLEEGLILREMMIGGSTQVEIAQLVGRHRSWVSRRIGLVERLHPDLVEWVKTGLLPAGTARRLMVLPAGNQLEFAAVVSQTKLGTEDTEILVGLWQKTSEPELRRYLLSNPREAIAHARPEDPRLPLDPRLSPRGQALQRGLRILQGVSNRVKQGLRPLPPPQDLSILRPELGSVSRMLPALQEAVGSAQKLSSSTDSDATSATPPSGAISQRDVGSGKSPGEPGSM